MKVFITGGTGFVGGHVIAELKQHDHKVAALVRRAGSPSGVNEIIGDVTLPETISVGKLSGCQAVIHLVGIIREFPRRGITFRRLHVQAIRNVLAACQTAGIGRYLHISALGADLKSGASYQRTKAEAEDLVKASGLDWTIFRPSVILGADGEFFRMIKGMVQRRIVPLIGDGSMVLVPVSVSTVAQAFVRSLGIRESIGKVYELGGEIVTYRKMMETLAEVMGKRVIFLKNPVFLLKTLTALLDRFAWFPLSGEQVIMSLEGSAPGDGSAYEALGLEHKGVKEIIMEALSG